MIQRKNINIKSEKPIVSFSPLFEGDINFWINTALDEELLEVLSKAKAVIFPQVVSQELYFFCRQRGIPIFPNYDVRFKFPGKIGQILLFRELDLPHPRSICFPRVASLGEHPGAKRPLFPKYPFVLKGNYGHEGKEVFLIEDEKDFEDALKVVKQLEKEGRFGFLVQEFIPSSYDLRIIICGTRFIPVWRLLGRSFKSNLTQEGRLIPCPDKDLENKALFLIKVFVERSGINLAAVDFLVKEGLPLFNEINYFFGRRAIGGSESFYNLWQKAVEEFLKKLDTCRF